MFTPTRVPQGVLNATSYFQGVMTELLVGIKCKIWVDDVFFYADTEDELLDTLDEILARLESVGMFAAAHKCTFFSREIVWCGKVYSQGRVSHDPVRLQGLSDMRRPETAAELMQFLRAMNWLRTSLSRMAEVVAPLRWFLEERMAGAARRTKRVAKDRYSSRRVDGGRVEGLGGRAGSCGACRSLVPPASWLPGVDVSWSFRVPLGQFCHAGA